MEPVINYNTIKQPAKGFYKEKGSKFIALVLPVSSEDEIKKGLKQIKKEYYDARHHCYAYRINPENPKYRSSDDGEPSGTAGKPILNQIFSRELYNVLVVVVRYFGGTKLGVSGLIKAYKEATLDSFNNAEIINENVVVHFQISFPYTLMKTVMKIINDYGLKILEQNFSDKVEIVLEVEKKQKKIVESQFEKIFKLDIKDLINNN